MAQIYVQFGTVNSITNAVTGVVFSDNPSVGVENPLMTLVTVDDYNALEGTVEISSVFYNVLFTKSDGASGLVYDSNLMDYYNTQYLKDKPITEDSFNDLGISDLSFVGLTQEEAIDTIYTSLGTRERVSVETTPDWDYLRQALSPNEDESLMELFIYDSTYVHLSSKLIDTNTSYIGVYDYSKSVGNRWSGWRISGGTKTFILAIGKGTSQILEEVIESNGVILGINRSTNSSTCIIPRSSSGIDCNFAWSLTADIVVNVNFTTGAITNTNDSDTNTFITSVTLV